MWSLTAGREGRAHLRKEGFLEEAWSRLKPDAWVTLEGF